MKLFITLEQAGEISGFSRRHIDRLMHTAGLKIIEIRGKSYLMRPEFDAWVAKYQRKRQPRAK